MIQTLKNWAPLRRVVKDTRTDRMAYAVSAVLLVLSLWLPPASAGVRVLHYDYPTIGKSGGVVSLPGGAKLLVPRGMLSSSLRLKIASLSLQNLLSGAGDKAEDAAAEALAGQSITLKGEAYRFRTYGPAPQEAVLSLPLPSALRAAAADLYLWDTQKWSWVPAQAIAEDGVIEAKVSAIPMLAVVASANRQTPVVATALSSEGAFDQGRDLLTEVYREGLHVNGDGTVSGAGTSDQNNDSQGTRILPVISNAPDGKPQPQVLTTVLLTDEARSKNIASLTVLAVGKMYGGVMLDYQGLDSSLRKEFVSFVAEAAKALHGQGKLLLVRVPTPIQVSADTWETGAYDWQALGAVADAIVVPAIASPSAHVADGPMDSLLTWAVGQVNRSKLQVELSAESYKSVGQTQTRVPYAQALAELTPLEIEDDTAIVEPGQNVTVSLPRLKDWGGVHFDTDTATYWVTYQDEQGQEVKIWLENATSMAHKLRMITGFNLRGVTLTNLVGDQADDRLWDLMKNYQELLVPSVETEFTLVWSVQNPRGESSTSFQPVETPVYVWQASDSPGDYTIGAALSADGGRSIDARSNSVSVEIPTATPTPTPTMTPTPTPTPTPRPTAKPQVVAASASRGAGFGYGIQAHMVGGQDLGRVFGAVQQIGFGWVKQQVEWKAYNKSPGQYSFGELDNIVNAAQAAGVKVLFSVVKAPKWARPAGDTDDGPPADPNTYAEFMRVLATHFKGQVQAYEIWNEQNLYYEWGGQGNKLSAAKYVALLRPAYQAIKAADPSATVVSGALTPTGWNDGNIAIDDRVYLQQMYSAGLRNYCDAIAAHPSGYNNPPDADWRTWNDPSTSKAKGHPSWYFRNTMEDYRNIMVANGDSAKRIWATEFGWASVEGLGVAPVSGYEYAADNTQDEQARYIVKAYQMAKAWGWVGPMFLWNLNFGPVSGARDEKAAFGIVRSDWGARPAFAALANMAK
jgi:spore germination protein YaaH